MPRPRGTTRAASDASKMTAATALELLSQGLEKFLVQPDITGYKPHPKQEKFHNNASKGRLFLGGNRAGKTTAGVVEDIYWLKQDHPYLDLSDTLVRGIPTRGRVVGVDFNVLNQVIIPEYKRWIPPSLLKQGSWYKSWDNTLKVLTLDNGATLDFKTYEQEMDKHSGTSRHFVHFDEEPPLHIYTENMMRLLDTKGRWWCTMTPLLGVTWLFDKMRMEEHPGEEEYSVDDNYVLQVSTTENTYLTKDAIDATFAGMDDEEKKSRLEGKFVEVGGLVFKNFDPKVHIIDPVVPPKHWELYMSLDSGWNNPTAILWHAVSPEGVVITFAEQYLKETTVEEHARLIHEREKQWGWQPYLRTGDPATKQTRETTGTSVQQEYAAHDIFLSLDSVPSGPGSVSIGIARMQAYMGNALINGKRTPAHWFITRDCENTIRELRRLRWATYSSRNLQHTLNAQETVHKKDDHTFDSARYFFTLLPDLKPDAPGTLDPGQQKPLSWQDALIQREQLIAAGELLDLSKPATQGISWDVTLGFDTLITD